MTCKKKNCAKNSISLSDYCGDHTGNEDFLKALKIALNSKSEFESCSIIEIEIPASANLIIQDKTISSLELMDCRIEGVQFKNINFIACEINDVEFIDCHFENCIFDDGVFEQVEFETCQLKSCTFKAGQLSNCTLRDQCLLEDTLFNFTKLSNFSIYELTSAKQTKFEQCILVLCTLSESNFDSAQFLYSEILRTAISYSSFRNAKFEGINQDFEQSGAPILSDFFAAKLEDDFKQAVDTELNNLQHADYHQFVISTIEWLLELNHSNYLPELSYLLNLAVAQEVPIFRYKQAVIDLYKRLYDTSIQLQNLPMTGQLFSEFTRLPEEIRTKSFLLPDKSVTSIPNHAILKITIDQPTPIKLKTLAQVTLSLAEIESICFKESSLQVEDIKKGSIVETLMGSVPDVVVYVGVIYATTKATLSIIKSGLEIKKLGLEVKKLEQPENKNIKDQIDTTHRILEIEQMIDNEIQQFDKVQKEQLLALIKKSIKNPKLFNSVLKIITKMEIHIK